MMTDNEQWVWERCECSANHTCLICATERAVAEADDFKPPQPANQFRYIMGAFIAVVLLHVALLIVVML